MRNLPENFGRHTGHKVQSFAQACSFSISTLQWHTPVPGLGPELCHDRSHACLGFPRPWYRRCVTVALGVSSVMVSGLACGSGTRAPLWPILPSTDTRVVSVVLRVIVLRSTHNLTPAHHKQQEGFDWRRREKARERCRLQSGSRCERLRPRRHGRPRVDRVRRRLGRTGRGECRRMRMRGRRHISVSIIRRGPDRLLMPTAIVRRTGVTRLRAFIIFVSPLPFAEALKGGVV